jgi:hypothetical protein
MPRVFVNLEISESILRRNFEEIVIHPMEAV